MTSRRDLLKAAAVIVASSSSIGLGYRRAGAQAARSQIDDVLRQAVDAGDAAGVVAMAATDKACSTRAPPAGARWISPRP
jgi:hypothetical protein